jgi:uncharacterized ferritin-like protein (DUF455 family)
MEFKLCEIIVRQNWIKTAREEVTCFGLVNYKVQCLVL